jgi:arylsulfatase A-like enzyme
VVRWPGQTKAGCRIEPIVLNVDFAPTLLSLAGLSPPESMQGRSIVPLLRGRRPADWRNAFYYRFYESAYGIGPHEGIRTDRYKLVHYLYGDHAWELYDLDSDPQELRNLLDDPSLAEVVQRLRARLDTMRKELRAEPVAGSP